MLAGIDLSVRAGEVHAIVGENGAGKSTLIKILGGVHLPDAGVVIVDGISRRLRSPREALATGIVVIHQELSLAPDMSAEENIFLGRFPRTIFGTVDRGAIRRRAKALFEQLGIAIDPGRSIGTFSIAQQQMVEIAKALSVEAQVLVLDEPTAVLDEHRVKTLFDARRPSASIGRCCSVSLRALSRPGRSSVRFRRPRPAPRTPRRPPMRTRPRPPTGHHRGSS